MAIEVTCPACGRQFELADELAGKSGRCKCGEALQVPQEPARPATDDTVECRHCGMRSRSGAVCEWCRQPFAGPSKTPAPREHPIGAPLVDHERGPETPAPVAVTVIRILMLLGLIFGWLAVVAFMLLGLLASFMPADEGFIAGAAIGIVGLFLGAVMGLTTWLWIALGRASNAAWWIYTVLLGLSLLFRPIQLLILILAASTPTSESVTGAEPAVLAMQIAFGVLQLAISMAVMVFWQQRDVKRWYGVC